MSQHKDSDQVQGEGNYDAAERYNESAHDFIQSEEGEKARQKLEQNDLSEEEKRELREAERVRDEHIKETDPAVSGKS